MQSVLRKKIIWKHIRRIDGGNKSVLRVSNICCSLCFLGCLSRFYSDWLFIFEYAFRLAFVTIILNLEEKDTTYFSFSFQVHWAYLIFICIYLQFFEHSPDEPFHNSGAFKLMFLNFINFVDPLIITLHNFERARRAPGIQIQVGGANIVLDIAQTYSLV